MCTKVTIKIIDLCDYKVERIGRLLINDIVKN